MTDAAIRPTSSGVRVPKAAELVARDLRRQIVRGQWHVGDALPPESALMDIYQVSRPTLREALRVLESEGLLSVKRGASGAKVHMPDVAVAARHAALLLQVRNTTIEDVFKARRVIEPAAVRMLAERKGKGALPQLRTKQEAEHDLFEDPDRFATSATEFHQMIVDLSGNNTLAVFSNMIFEIVDRHHHASFNLAPARRQEFAEEGSEHHKHVLDLVAAGDADGAEAFWQFHIDGAAERFMRVAGSKSIVDLLE